LHHKILPKKGSWQQSHTGRRHKLSEIQPRNAMLQKPEKVQRFYDFRGHFGGDYSTCLF